MKAPGSVFRTLRWSPKLRSAFVPRGTFFSGPSPLFAVCFPSVSHGVPRCVAFLLALLLADPVGRTFGARSYRPKNNMASTARSDDTHLSLCGLDVLWESLVGDRQQFVSGSNARSSDLQFSRLYGSPPLPIPQQDSRDDTTYDLG